MGQTFEDYDYEYYQEEDSVEQPDSIRLRQLSKQDLIELLKRIDGPDKGILLEDMTPKPTDGGGAEVIDMASRREESTRQLGHDALAPLMAA